MHRLLGEGLVFVGHDDDFRAGGDGGEAGEFTALGSHRFKHHHATMAAGGVFEVIYGPHECAHGSIHANSHLGEFEVVVDRCGHADDAEVAFLRQALCPSERTITTDDDERADAQLIQHVDHLRAHFWFLEVQTTSRA